MIRLGKRGAIPLAMALWGILAGCGGCGAGGREAASPAPPAGTATGSATISWTPVNAYTDGSPLDPAGYRVYARKVPGGYTTVINIPNMRGPGSTIYTFDNLVQGTYYFAVTAYDNTGVESNMSAEMSWTIR